MSFVAFYSHKLLSGRQRIVLFGSVTICFCAFIYTYLACEYLCHSMLISIADLSPHVRIFLSKDENKSEETILRELANSSSVERVGGGYYFQGKVHVETNKPIEKIGDRPEIFFSEYKTIDFIGYPFDAESYLPPMQIENVYSTVNHRKVKESPQDAPVQIMNDQDPLEQKVNWCIISNNLTSIIYNGPLAFGDGFKLTSPDGFNLEMTTAGYLSRNPLQLVGDSNLCTVILKESSLFSLVPKEKCTRIIDISLRDRLSAFDFSQKLKDKYSLTHVISWMDTNESAINFLKGIRTTTFAGILAIVLLSIIGINIIMSMLVIEKSKQLAILYAIGLSTIELRCIFLRIGLRIALCAIVFGGGFAYLMALYSRASWQKIVDNFCHAQENGLVFSTASLVFFILGLLVFCGIASWIPSRHIVISDPINTIRDNN